MNKFVFAMVLAISINAGAVLPDNYTPLDNNRRQDVVDLYQFAEFFAGAKTAEFQDDFILAYKYCTIQTPQDLSNFVAIAKIAVPEKTAKLGNSIANTEQTEFAPLVLERLQEVIDKLQIVIPPQRNIDNPNVDGPILGPVKFWLFNHLKPEFVYPYDVRKNTFYYLDELGLAIENNNYATCADFITQFLNESLMRKYAKVISTQEQEDEQALRAEMAALVVPAKSMLDGLAKE